MNVQILFIITCVAHFLLLIVCEEDYYAILNLPRNATIKQIKQAYRQMSLKTHPDRNQDNNSNEMFSKVARAYEVLGDPKKKEIYDKYGEEGLQENNIMPNFHAESIFNFFGFPFDSMYNRKHETESKSMVSDLYLSLNQLFFGDILNIYVNRPVICVNISKCIVKQKDCAGPGVKMVLQMFGGSLLMQTQKQDPSCVDQGKAWNKSCSHCPNGPTENEMTKTTLFVDSGMDEGDHITSYRIGPQSIDAQPSNIIFKIHQIPHPKYKRVGDDLHTIIDITLDEALYGFTKEYFHISQKILQIAKKTITQDREKEVVRGWGMPIKSRFGKTNSASSMYGNLVITYNILYPNQLTDIQKKALHDILSSVKNWSKASHIIN